MYCQQQYKSSPIQALLYVVVILFYWYYLVFFIRFDDIKRPAVGNLNPKADVLTFQQLELDHYIGPAPYPGMPGAQTGPVPVIRMFGTTGSGHSVCCHVHGFSPYLYVPLPDNFSQTDCFPFKVGTMFINRLCCFVLGCYCITFKRFVGTILIYFMCENTYSIEAVLR